MDESYETAISRFVDHLKFEKRYSAHTVRSYQDDLNQFHDYLNNQFGKASLTSTVSPFVRSWLASLKDDGLSSRSIIRKISSLKSFFKFAIRSGMIVKTPMTNISTPRISRRLPSFVEEADMATLFRHVEFPDDWNGKTERLAIEMLYQLGLRLSELVNCKENHVDFANSTIKVLGKGNKERMIPLNAVLLRSIRDYITEKRRRSDHPDSIFLLVNENGKKLYPKFIYRVVKKYLPMVTTIDKKSPHTLRHSFATHLSNNGAELNAIKELLGHASLAATQIYTHNTIDKLKNIHKKAHPKG